MNKTDLLSKMLVDYYGAAEDEHGDCYCYYCNRAFALSPAQYITGVDHRWETMSKDHPDFPKFHSNREKRIYHLAMVYELAHSGDWDGATLYKLSNL